MENKYIIWDKLLGLFVYYLFLFIMSIDFKSISVIIYGIVTGIFLIIMILVDK